MPEFVFSHITRLLEKKDNMNRLQLGLCWPTNAVVGLQELQPVYDVLRPDRQVIIANTALFGLWLGLPHVKIPQYF